MEEQNHPVFSEGHCQYPEFYLDIDQAADLLNISRAELLRLVECGAVPAHKLRHRTQFCWKFKRSELEELVDLGCETQGPFIQ